VVYLWNKPPDHLNEYRFWKESYVSYFEPLGWYIVSSVYRDEMEAPARKIMRQQAIINVSILAVSVFIGIILLRKMTRRLKLLTSYAEQLSSTDFVPLNETDSAIRSIAAKSRDEIGGLARAFAYMIQSLLEYIERLKESTAAKEKMESELRIAHDIQMNILPKIFPPFPDRKEFDIFAFIKPAREVGGDFYDFLAIDDEHILFVIADVSGKGIPAALFMAVTKTLIKSKAMPGMTPDRIMTRVNQELYQGNDANMFVSVFCGILNTATGEISYTNGGHNPPVLIRKGGEVSFLEGKGELLVGVFPDVEYSMDTLTLEPSDSLFLYTDGVTEAMSLTGELFSDMRLKEIIRKEFRRSIQGLVAHIDEQLQDFSRDAEQSDDITMLIVQYRG
jgi:sigma-B regulation protein RsbU (phosphoserine phosphatase)